MTENEAKLLDKLDELANDTEVDMYSVATLNFFFEESANTIRNLIGEIQAYRAIGTVEELKEAKVIYNEILLSEGKLNLPKKCVAYEVGKLREKELREYKAIGTIEEIKALKNKHIGKDNMVISSSDLMTILNSDSEELKQYKEVGTVEEFKALKEKSLAKKPILSRSMMTKREFQICPICERLVLYDGIKFDCCQHCGQKLDWSE